MGERSAPRRRVLVEDARHDGRHLRATWHPEAGQFVISTWSSDVCTGAARLATDDAARLAGLVLDGLADAAASARVAPALPPTRSGLAGVVDRLRWLVRGTPPREPAARGRVGAVVRTLPRRSA